MTSRSPTRADRSVERDGAPVCVAGIESAGYTLAGVSCGAAIIELVCGPLPDIPRDLLDAVSAGTSLGGVTASSEVVVTFAEKPRKGF